MLPEGVSAADGTKGRLGGVAATHIEAILAEGYFRNAGDGFVFIEPIGGKAISGPDGKPLIFTLEDVAEAATKAPPPDDVYRRMALEGMFPEPSR
jgi:hypothetical protein